MDYPIGIEMTEDFLSFELNRAAMKLVKDVMLAKPGESVVITGDSSSDKRVMKATANAAYALGANPVIIDYPTSPVAYTEPIKPIGNAVSVADIWIEYAYSSIMLSPSFQRAMEYGCRYINLTGMDVTMIVNTIGNVDYPKMVELGETLKELIYNADEVVIKDSNGTNLRAYNRGREIRHSGQLATQKGYPIMVGGQISWCPVEETINGKLVFDGALFPPAGLGVLKNPVELTLENGRVTAIEGGAEAVLFSEWLGGFSDPNMYRLAHYSLGFNPGVNKPTGRIVEDERVFGCMEFGIGSQGSAIRGSYWTAASHTDGVVLKPSIILDGVYLEKDGIYLNDKVRKLCSELGAKGY